MSFPFSRKKKSSPGVKTRTPPWKSNGRPLSRFNTLLYPYQSVNTRWVFPLFIPQSTSPCIQLLGASPCPRGHFSLDPIGLAIGVLDVTSPLPWDSPCGLLESTVFGVCANTGLDFVKIGSGWCLNTLPAGAPTCCPLLGRTCDC